MSAWTSSNFITSGGLTRREQSIITAFYTQVPGPSHPDVVAPGTDLSDDDFIAAYSKDNWSTIPQRILIQSRGALNELQQITKVPLRYRPVCMVPPFKLLIHHRKIIKSRLDELRQTVLDRDDHLASPTSHSVDQNLTIDHLQCIHDFIQTDLFNYIGLDLKIRDGDIDEVLFEEVYHLFKPGDLVLSAATGDDQLYQVYSVCGGRLRLSDSRTGGFVPGPNLQTFGTAPGSWTDVKVVCYIMGWDGDHIGPLQTTHRISYFSGARRITDLDLYPIQFRKDASGLRSRLHARGRKLVKCSGHQRYTGNSVPLPLHLKRFVSGRLAKADQGDSSDDSEDGEDKHVFDTGTVRSDIYVDYKTCYSMFFATDPVLSNLSTVLGEEAETLESLGALGPWNYSDHEVDGQLSDNFLSEHRHLTKYGKPMDNLDDDEGRLELLPPQLPAFIFGSRKWGKL